MITANEKKRYYGFMGFLFVLCVIMFLLGYKLGRDKCSDELNEVRLTLDVSRTERDSLVQAYKIKKKQAAELEDKIREINEQRKKLKEEYYAKIKEPIALDSTKLESEILDFLKMYRGIEE